MRKRMLIGAALTTLTASAGAAVATYKKHDQIENKIDELKNSEKMGQIKTKYNEVKEKMPHISTEFTLENVSEEKEEEKSEADK